MAPPGGRRARCGGAGSGGAVGARGCRGGDSGGGGGNDSGSPWVLGRGLREAGQWDPLGAGKGTPGEGGGGAVGTAVVTRGCVGQDPSGCPLRTLARL